MLIYLLPVLGYLFGSISTAVVVARLLNLDDPRQVGSGNPGATNVLRMGSKLGAILTLAGDLGKGLVPVLIARALSADAVVLVLVALGAFLGHLYPVFFGFKGGKGVATALGVFLGVSPWLGLALLLTWLAVAWVSRYSSLSALCAAALAPLYAWGLLREPVYVVFSLAVTALLIWRHRKNIRNLIAGTETKIGQTAR